MFVRTRHKQVLVIFPLVGILLVLISYSITSVLSTAKLTKPGRLYNRIGRPKVARRDSQNMPVVYMGGGFLNCGGPLIPDQCSLRPFSYSTSYTQQGFDVAGTVR